MNISVRAGEMMTDKAGCVRPEPVSWDVLVIVFHSSAVFQRKAYILQPHPEAQGRFHAFLRHKALVLNMEN